MGKIRLTAENAEGAESTQRARMLRSKLDTD
jgi:hypothetical protein